MLDKVRSECEQSTLEVLSDDTVLTMWFIAVINTTLSGCLDTALSTLSHYMWSLLSVQISTHVW